MIMVKEFSKKLSEMGFFEEWARSLGAKLEPAVLVMYAVEALRSEDDGKREAFSAFVTFIHSRSWSEVFNELTGELGAGEAKTLSRMAISGAEPFFLKFRTLLVGQVEDYWRQVAASQKQDAIEVLSALERAPLDKLEEKIRNMIEARLGSLNHKIMEGVIEELRKRLEEGEDWKHRAPPEN
jgi:hypothetical protein